MEPPALDTLCWENWELMHTLQQSREAHWLLVGPENRGYPHIVCIHLSVTTCTCHQQHLSIKADHVVGTLSRC